MQLVAGPGVMLAAAGLFGLFLYLFLVVSATHGITPCQVHTEIWRVSLRPVLRPKLKALEEMSSVLLRLVTFCHLYLV